MNKTHIKSICLILAIIIVAALSVPAFAQEGFRGKLARAISISHIFSEKYRKSSDGGSVNTDHVGVGEKITIYVSAGAVSDNANGSENAPYTSVEAARDAVRKLDKDNYSAIDIIIKTGTYVISEPIRFTEEDAGTENCTVRYIGEDGARIVGGVSLKSEDFSGLTEEEAELFPESARDKIVQTDLKEYGFSVDYINEIQNGRDYISDVPFLSVDGVTQTLARYPNEEWINIGPGSTMLDQYGNPTTVTDNEGGEYEAKTVQIEYGTEHSDHIRSWHSTDDVRVAGRFAVLWVSDNSGVLEFDEDRGIMTVPYQGGYAPVEGGLLYWYNIPEELDVPGEYYIDRNAVLYYYPGDGFETSEITLPLSRGFMDIDGADCITIENLTFESSLASGITAKADHITIRDCSISSVAGDWIIDVTGDDILVQGNHLHDANEAGIRVISGDLETLRRGNSLVYNNKIHDWGLVNFPYEAGISVSGCGIVVSHNELYDSNSCGIDGEAAYITAEYNDIHDILKASDDIGATGISGYVENITRYNYIHNIGSVGAAAAAPNLNKMGSAAIYWDGGSSFAEAYGNVIETVKGHGVIMNGGRNLSVHGNLIIDCSMWYVQAVAMFYQRALENGFTGCRSIYPEYVNSPVWIEANPELSKIIEDLDQTVPGDPYAWCATAGNVILNNWTHFNKYNRAFSNWGVRPYYIEDIVYDFSGENIDVVNGLMNEHTTAYNSRRDKVDLEELFKTAADVIEIDWESFNRIGIVESDWKLD